jgi:hypothetical protein
MIQDLKDKYLSIYENLKKDGTHKKYPVLALTLGCLLLVFLKMEGNYQYRSPYNIMSQSTLIFIFIGIAAIVVFIILQMNPVMFLPKNRLARFGFHYKKDVVGLLQKEIPEIKEYVPYQKIHQKVFRAARLFDPTYSDYRGDDWMKGEYGNVRFELCELLVMHQLKPIFHGFFIKCYFPEIHDNQYLFMGDHFSVVHRMEEFESNYRAKIRKSIDGRNLYFAIDFEKRFLTYETKAQIESMDYDYYLLKDTIQLLKHLIDKAKVESTIMIH